MSKKEQYIIDQSLRPSSDDEEDLENVQIIDQEIADDKILDQTNLTFTSFIKTTFKIEKINKEINIAISKFEFNQLKSFCSDLKINLHYAQDYIEVQSDKIEENEGDLLFLKQQVSSFFYQYSSTKLNFDLDDLRAIQTSNLLINELQKYQIYLIRMRSIDQKISLYLVSKNKNLMDVAKNLENRLRGIRIFFQDCVGYMTKLHKNRDFKECLTKLRLSHYQKVLRNKIESDFQNIVFHDILDKNNTFSSLIVGFNFPYYMQGKKDICQKLFRYISTQIQIQLALFIQFPTSQESQQLAFRLVNITNEAKKTNFLCSSQVFQGISSVGIIGHPKDLITLIDEYLSPDHDFDKSQGFIQGLKIGILEKNFCHTIGDQQITFDTTGKFLQRKPEIELNSREQLKLIKINKKINFKSYCNLLKFICEQKYKLCTEQTEAKQLLELEYISQKLRLPENDLNFFEAIQSQIDFSHQHTQEKQQQQNYKNQQNQNKNSDFGNQVRNQDHPRNQNRNDDNQRNQYRNQDNQRNQNRNSDHPRNQNRNQDRNDDNQNNQDRNLDQNRNQNRNQDHPRNQNRNQNRNEDHPNNLVQSQIQSSVQSQKSTEDLYQPSNNSQQDNSSNQDQEELINPIFPINHHENTKIDQQDQIFQSSIIKQLKEQNQKFVISPEYKDYFQKLIGQDINLSVSYEQNEKNKYFICLNKDEIFKIKCFKKNIKIFEKLQDARQFCLGEKNIKIIEVMVYQHAEKDNQIDEENKMNNSYFYTTKDNQIYPISLKE